MRRLLDRATGRVTMYRLVSSLLVLVALAALVFALFGAVPYGPVDLIASAAVALASTLGSNWAFARMFHTSPHLESSIITGLILFFLFWPSTLLPDLGTLALAGVLATASKYLIAWRGRHILNPAATGAAIIALLQLNSAVWWVATGVLLPFVAVGAFLLLYRTNRLPMGLVFVLVTGLLVVVRLVSGGQSIDAALTAAFVSYPLVFFAGFMLSEPLTMAPRRWQQLVLAALIGALFSLAATGFPLGPVTLSFEIALLVGNALAFLVGQRRGLRLSFLGKRQLTPTAWAFDFAPSRPVSFRAGQYMELTVPHSGKDTRGSRRMFSIASAPSTVGQISFGLRMPAVSSTFKRAFLELEKGETLHATSVGGDFLLPRSVERPVLLVAGGIGVTPFVSQLTHDRARGLDRDVVLVYSVSSLTELAFRDELAAERVLLVAPEPPADLPPTWRFVGHGPVNGELLEREVPGIRSRAAYVSGAPSVVSSVRKSLRRLGVRRVSTDFFSGY